MNNHNKELLQQQIEESSFFSDKLNAIVLDEQSAVIISNAFKIHLRYVYIESLKLQISPLRYIKNRESISFKEQIALAETVVTVAGAGGLGGHVAHILARTGIGTLYIFDYDNFEESNMNRQLFATTESIASSKADITKQMINLINPAVQVQAVAKNVSTEANLLKKTDIIVDALDNTTDRLLLGQSAKKIGIPLVHGSIAGFEGRILTQYPEDNGVATIIGGDEKSPPAEAFLGTPAVTPAVIGALQAMEVIKIILKKPGVFHNTMLYLNLNEGSSQQFHF